MRIKATSADEDMQIYYIPNAINLLRISVNMYEVYNVYNVINSYIFICTCWFYFHSEALVHGHEIFKTI